MPQVACAPAVNCRNGVDSPTANLTSEGPDIPKCFRYGFGRDSSVVCEFDLSLCEAFSAVGSDVGVLCPPFLPPCLGDYCNPVPPVIYSSNAQSCTVDCGGFSETYEVAPGTFVALSQAQADEDARAFACQLAAMQCTGPTPQLFTNTPQTCTVVCPDNTSASFTTPADFFTAFSQGEANAQAFLFACDVAALTCGGLPPTNIEDSSGEPPAEPIMPLWGNFAQSCSATCPDGSLFTFIVPGGTYFRTSRAEANAAAFSLACDQANHRRVCLSDLEAAICAGEFYGEFLDATGIPAPIVFSVVAGSLPPGITLSDDGFLQGVPTTSGAYVFAIRATGSDSSFAQRTYSQNVIEITPATVPDATLGTPYAEALSADGTVGSLTWSISAGILPDGLTLHPGTGVISGTPTIADTYDFTVAVMDSQTTCTKDYQILVSGTYMFWKMEEGAGDRVDSIQSVALVPFTTAGGDSVTGPAGKILNGALVTVALATVSPFAGLLTALVPQLAYTAGGSFTIAGWARRTIGNVSNPHIYVELNLYDDAIGSNLLATAFLDETFGNAQFFVLDDVAGFSNVNIATGHPVGTFFFFALIYDGATGIISGQIDGGGIQAGAGVASIINAPFGELLVRGGPAPTATNACQYDEIGYWPEALSQADINHLYNAGAGQTSPIVFP